MQRCTMEPVSQYLITMNFFEAYACHLQFVNQKLTQNDENFFTRREDFELVIERIFFHPTEEKPQPASKDIMKDF